MGAFLRSSFAHVDNVIPVIKTITRLLLSRLQGNKPHRNSPEPSETLRSLPRPSGTNLSEPSGTYTSWTYASIHRNPPKSSGTCFRNRHHFIPELSGTFRNLPPEPIRQHTPELSETFRNLPPEPAPCDPRRHTPELNWAEDPISLRCWGKKKKKERKEDRKKEKNKKRKEGRKEGRKERKKERKT